MKKILHVIDTLSVGGAEKLLVDIINELSAFENHLLILRGPLILKPEIQRLSSFVNLKTSSFRQALMKVPFVRRYINEKEFDIVHSHLYESNIIARLSTPGRVKLFNSIHAVSSQASYQENKATFWLERMTYKKRHHLINVSKTVEEDFEEHVGIKGESTVLYNFIADAFFQNKPKKEFDLTNLKLVAVGTLKDQKNYPYLIEAFRQMPATVSLDIYGEGPLRCSLQAAIDQHKLNITLCGLKHKLYDVLPQYDLFVMSSFFEGQPVALLEAMACGLPALLADIPVLRETGKDMALYFSLHNPADLAQLVTKISHKKYELGKMSQSGYEFAVANARKDSYVKKLNSLYTA